MITRKLSEIFYGGDYNPEQWPELTWQEDVRLMKEAGVNLVSLGIFSWAKLEPRPGKFSFNWLDRMMDLLAENGVFVDLANATASPPPWLARLHPDSLPMDADGRRYHPGARQHYCPNSAAYKKHATELTCQIAMHYRKHPALVMWHINNEYACHVHQCLCDNCARAFRSWLQSRYKNLDELNAHWGTAFWSQWYSNWDEILPPRKAPTFCNPAQQLDYKRFMSDSILELYKQEAQIVRRITPGLPVTTNFMGFFDPLDYFKWAKHLDFVSWDAYPDPSIPQESAMVTALMHDMHRSYRGGQPFVLMEQVTSQANWRKINVLKRPGMMRLWSYQAMAHGADGIMFFQWRASRAGAEKFHGAMVPHVGTKKSRIFEEVKQLGSELKKLRALLDSRVPAKVAIVMDWQSKWALELDSKPAKLNQWEHLCYFYKGFHQANIAVDIVEPETDWSGYKLVVAPVLYMQTEKGAQNIRKFVKGGGTFITTYFSGIVDENDRIHLGGYPALMKDVLGLWVEEWDPYPEGATNRLKFKNATRSVSCSLWSDLIHLDGAKAMAAYEGDFYAGKPALTVHSYGKGEAYYFGTRPEENWTFNFLAGLCQRLKITAPIQVPPGVETTLRKLGKKEFLFLLNHERREVSIELESIKGRDLLSGKSVSKSIELGPYGVAIVELGG